MPVTMTFVTDTDYLADVLADGEWHRLDQIIERSQRDRGHGFTVHSRAADLRKRGVTVEQRCERAGRRVNSFYRIADSLGEPSSNHHASGEEASMGVTDGDSSPSDTGDTPTAPSLPRVADRTPVPLTLFGDQEVAA